MKEIALYVLMLTVSIALLLTLSVSSIYGLNWLATNVEFIDVSPIKIDVLSVILVMMVYLIAGSRAKNSAIENLRVNVSYDLNLLHSQLSNISESVSELESIKQRVDDIANDISNNL